MSSEEQEFENWEGVIKNYIDSLDDNSKKTEYLDELISRFYKANLLSIDDIETTDFKQDIKKIHKIKPTAKSKLKLKKYYDSYDSNQTIVASLSAYKKLLRKNSFYNIWICKAINEGFGVYPATHVAKLTHSMSQALSIVDNTINDKNTHLSTISLNQLIVDGAYPNAASSKIAKFLLLKHDGNLLSECILNKNNILSNFSESVEELDFWTKVLKTNLSPKPSSDFLKQVYFPIADDYHLLMILKSSALIQNIFNKFFEKSARKERDKILKIIANKKYLTNYHENIVGAAKIFTVSSQPQNVSVLSGSRSGAIRLFSTQPPTWESQLKPPIYKKSLFDNLSNFQINEDINYLREFLLRFKHLDLSIKDPKRYAHLVRWVESIIDGVIFYANSIQKIPASWSADKNIKLAKEHQYFLDPYRVDEEFQARYIATDWQTVICDDFAAWLNRKLVGKDKQFTPQAEHTRLWKKLFKPALREDIESIKAEKQYQQKEVTA